MKRWLLEALTSLWMDILARFDALALRFLPSKPGNPHDVLLVRTDRGGDFVLFLGAAAAIRRLYPAGQYRITLVVTEPAAELARLLPHFDRVWSLSLRKFSRNLPYRWTLIRRVRNQGFGVAIQGAYSRMYHGDVLVYASAAPRRIGLCGDAVNIPPWLKRNTDRWYTQLVPNPPRPVMELETNAHFVRQIGGTDCTAKVGRIDVSEDHLNSELQPLLQGPPAMVLAPGASHSLKSWPIERFIEVVRQVHVQTGWRIWICGDVNDHTLGETVRAACPEISTVNLAGRTSLVDLAILLGHSKLVLTNDTAAAHLAAAVGTPAVAVPGVDMPITACCRTE